MGLHPPDILTYIPPEQWQSRGNSEIPMKKILAASWNHHQLNDNSLCRAPLQYRNTPSRRDGALSCTEVIWPSHRHTPSQTSRLDLQLHCKTNRLNFGTFMAKLLLLDLTDGIMSEHRVDESSCGIDAS